MPTKKKKKSTKEKVMVTFKSMLEELGAEPKKSRARLRKEGHSAKGGRYDDMEVGGKLHKEFLEILS